MSVGLYLAIEAVTVSSLPSTMPPDAVIVKDLGDGGLGLAFGELKLSVLELDDLLAEGRALLDVIDGQRQRTLHHGDGIHRDDQALLRQFLHQLDEALAFLGAEQVLGRQRDVVEEQFRRVGGIEAELLELAAAAKALGARRSRPPSATRPWRPAFGSVLATTMMRLACWPLVMKVLEPLRT